MQFTKLITEDKEVVKSLKCENGDIINGNLVTRIYQQDNGKFCLTISEKVQSKDRSEDIIMWTENLDSVNNCYSLLDVMKNINV